MKPIPALEFASIVGGVARGITPESEILGFALDSREVREGDLFLAVKGANVDGHDFVESAVAAGAAGALVERPVGANLPQIVVPNLVGALAAYAKSVRSQFRGPVVGVTGSAGKTTTKELIAAALSPLGPVLKTEGNRNSEYSSPLLWSELNSDTRAAVIEMGMRGFGQIAHLCSFTKPIIGVITNIGVSHIEMVGGQDGVARAKGELLQALPLNGHAVLWAEDPFLDRLRTLSRAPVSTFGFSELADCRISSYRALNWRSSEISGEVHGRRFEAALPAVGRHLALDAAAAVLIGSLAGVEPLAAASALESAQLPLLRMQIVEHEGVIYVVDAYNASPPSVVAALETLHDVSKGQTAAVLGEMKELGGYTEEGHREVGRAVARLAIDRVVLIGESTKWIAESALEAGFPKSGIIHAKDLAEVAQFLKVLSPGNSVLVKGSRALALERALEFLKEPVH